MTPKYLSAQIADYVYAGAAARLIDNSKSLIKTAVEKHREREKKKRGKEKEIEGEGE